MTRVGELANRTPQLRSRAELRLTPHRAEPLDHALCTAHILTPHTTTQAMRAAHTSPVYGINNYEF